MRGEEAAAALGWHPSRLSRYENARSYPTTADVAAALDLYGADTGRREALIELARSARQRGWWSAYNAILPGVYMDMEDRASEIRSWEPNLVHGLLQTPEYTRLIMETLFPDEDRDQLEQRVRVRVARKAVVSRGDRPRFHFVLDEAVFRRMASHPDVLAGQIKGLLGQPPNVTIQVALFGINPGIEGGFTVLSFPNGSEPDQAYIESPAGNHYLDGADDVAAFNSRFRRIMHFALSEPDSAEWMRALVQD